MTKSVERVLVWLLMAGQVFLAIPVEAAAPRPRARVAPASLTAPNAASPIARPNRRVPAVDPVPQWPVFSRWPTDAEIFRARVFAEPLVPIGTTTPEENAALAQALATYLRGGGGEHTGDLVAFLESHHLTPWRASLQLNLGIVYRRTGYFLRAVRCWEEAWGIARNATDARLRAVADRAVGELAQIHARLGNHQQLAELLKVVEGRDIGGSASEMISGARQGLWIMRHRPEVAFRCGPFGLHRILMSVRPDHRGSDRIAQYASTMSGTTLLENRALAHEVGLKLQMARRLDRGAAVLTPALLHWEAGHFAALIKEEGGRYLIQDPTFGEELWISRRALGDETSGYMLVPEGPLPAGWRAVPDNEGALVWGKGQTYDNNPEDQEKGDDCSGSECCEAAGGMARYGFHTMLVSLHIWDTPAGYSPPRGPGMEFSVHYHQREFFQPQTFSYWNLGPKWTSDWISFLEDDPATPSQPVKLYVAGGGQETFTGYSPATGRYAPHYKSQAVAARVSTAPIRYEVRWPDGSFDEYAQPDGAATFPRRVFITRRVDPQGNAVQLTYDANLRLVAITDAIGQVTALSYGLAEDPLKVTGVADPFGRAAAFEYENGRLARITDVIGMQSSFTYGVGDFVTTMTTPYGTTRFEAWDEGRRRWVQATDPLGGKERLEYLNSNSAGIQGAEASALDTVAASELPTGFEGSGSYLAYRNTFYWDKRAMALAPGDYTKAKLVHWLHGADLTMTTSVIENEKNPLESTRTFHKYPGQSRFYAVGTHAKPSVVGKVLDDGSSRIWQYEYNALGKVIRSTDPVGRTTVYTYAENGIDLLRAERVNGQNLELIRSYTYNDKHQPLTYADARGATTTYTYNTAGQVLTVTTPPAQGQGQGATTTNTYDANGYLTQTSGPTPGATTTFTYDDYGRRRTVTDPAGLTITFDYDALDRVTRVSYPDGTHQETVYNRLDVEKRRDRLGRWAQFFHDALRREVAARDATGQTIQYQYGGTGCPSCTGGGDQLTAYIDANGNATRWEYDLQGRVTQETRADASSATFTYETTSSRVKQKTDRKGVTTTFEYFLDGKLKRKSYSDSTPAVNYTYDPITGLPQSAANGTDTLTWGHDSMGRLTSEVSTKNASTVGWSYDDAGNRVTLTLDGTTYLSYGYDQQSRLTSITRGAQSFGLGYDTASRRTSLTYPSGVVTSYGYDGETHLTSVDTALGGTSLARSAYVFDAAGERTRKTTLDWAEDYRYDNISRVITVDRSAGPPSRWRFAYDAAGNRTAAQTDDAVLGATFNNVNELGNTQAGGALLFQGTTNEPASVTVAGKAAQTASDNSFAVQGPVPSGTSNVVVAATDASGNTRTNTYQVSASGAGASYTYDADGNLATKSEGGDSWTYEWNAENQLTRVTKNGAEAARFTYDPSGRRVEKVAGGVTTTYTYDREDILREIRGTTTRMYVHGPGVDEPLAVDDGSALSYFHADALGSIAKLTNVTGAVTLARQYDVWGNLLAGAEEPGYAFTGREWDPETGLYYYRNRYYSALQGRFISEDPIGLRGGSNLYVYVGDDPVNAIDPYGWQGWTPNIRRPIECELFWGTYAKKQGEKFGWPYAHCLASCLIAQFCSQPQSVAAGFIKETADTLKCAFTRDPGSCDSAFQPSDFKDNFYGGTCPKQTDCWQNCDPLKGQTGDKAPPPGPMGGWGKK